ncbi:hypothetical protein EV356DRAFT_560437 [Viridothelium virens]|uniref:Zn(2)-C6 fungal-type domain-containing protein n=1 Tax=Viridothelium virens TaxID=1048519 RepID=A0A6A6H3G9_VIRVR|nr:hypothetical protein EV356DRAFT_560437 [Viridothelium virens]
MSTPGDQSASASPAVANPSNSANEQATQSFACVLCSQRKIKCDRVQPCSRCVKSRAECVYRAPDPPKRRKRKEPEGDEELRGRLHDYERLLKQAGIEVKNVTGSSENRSSTWNADQVMDDLAKPKTTVPSQGHLFMHGSKTKYHENSLYVSVEHEFQEHADMFKEELEPEEEPSSYLESLPNGQNPANLLFGSSPTNQDLRRFVPPSDHARQMWAIFKDRVDPLVKIFEISHREKRFLASLDCFDTLMRATQAWLFAVYLIAVVSLNNEECITNFGEPKIVLFRRLKYATQQALNAAGLLRSSDAIVLQAYVLFLISVVGDYDAGTYWSMTGIALRMAQRGGLHRDQSSFGTDSWPWHAEMRRRLWWQISLIDLRASELTGLGPEFSFLNWDTKLPLNVNDSDLNIAMTELPPERTGATDMMYCLIGYEMRSFFREVRTTPTISIAAQNFQLTEHSAEEKDKVVDELERRIEQKFLRYCDPLVPLHHLCLILARAAIASSRLMIHYPRNQSTEAGADLPVARRDMLFTTALKVIEYHNLVYENPSIRKFVWSMESRFPWHALIFLLIELRTRTAGDIDRAWVLVEQLICYNPDLLKETRKVLHIACGSLTLKAWDARLEDLRTQEWRDRARTGIVNLPPENTASAESTDMISLDPALAVAPNGIFGFSPMNWSQWDELILQNFELPMAVQETPEIFN